MRLPLTAEQFRQIEPHMQPGFTILGRLDREPFDGTNGATSGRLTLIFTAIPGARLDAVRAAIAGEPKPARKRESRRGDRH